MSGSWRVRTVAVLLSALAGMMAVSDTRAQQKKLPPPTKDDVQKEFSEVPDEKIEKFSEAYEKDDSPRLLVLVGMDARVGAAGGFDQNEVAENAQQQGGIGTNLSLFDQTGITESIKSGIEGWLAKNRGLDLINLESLGTLDRREANVLAQNNEQAALALLTTKLNADLLYYIKFQPVDPSQQQGEVGAYKVVNLIIDAQRGRQIDSDAREYRGSTNIERARMYSASLAEWFIDNYVDYVEKRPAARFFQVRMLGLRDSKQGIEVSKIISGIEGVEGRVRPEFTSNADDSYADYRVRFDGYPEDLALEIETNVEDEMGLSLSGFDVQEGRMNFRLGAPKPPPPQPTWKALQSPDSETVVDFKAAYDAKDRPSIGVVINWLVRPDQMSAEVQRTMPMVLMDGDPRVKNAPQGPDVIGIRVMEGLIMESFRSKDVRVIQPDQIRTLLNKQQQKVTDLDGDRPIATLLSVEDGFEILVEGVANIVSAKDEPEQIQYSFTVTNLRNGEFLGAQRWPDEQYKEFKIDPRSASDVGAYIGGRLLSDIYENHLKSASTMTVEIHKAPGPKQVSQLAEAIRQEVAAVFQASTPSFDREIGRFSLRYTGSFSAIQDKLDEICATMPFTLKVDEANAGKIVATMQLKSLPQGNE